MAINNISRREICKRAVLSCISMIGLMRAPAVLAAKIIAGLRRIKGRIINRGDADYEQWRAGMVWYLFKPNHYPDTIIQARSEQDVIETVNYARTNGVKISIRSTGHHITGASLRNGGILLDLSQLKGIEVNPAEKTAWIQPGLRSHELLAELKQHGMTFPAAHTGIVGLGGFLLGGGLGWNLQQWGVACHSVIAAEIITADGNKVMATPTENRELLWALRGAGLTFFAVVVRLQLKLYPLPQCITKNTYIFTHDQIPAVTGTLDELVPEKDKRVEVLTILKHGEDVPAVSHEGVIFIVTIIAFVDSMEQAQSLLAPFEQSSLGEQAILKKERVVTTYDELYAAQSVTDSTSQLRTSSENVWTDEPSRILRLLSDIFIHTPSKRSFVLAAYGVKGMPENDTSLTYFADNYVVCTVVADEEAQSGPNFDWIDEAVNIMQPMTRGRYMNEIDTRRYPEHIQDCFSKENWKRLQKLREKYDPAGVFLAGMDLV